MHGKTLTSQQVKHMQRYVRGVLVFGIVTSVSANVIHSLTGGHDKRWLIYTSAILAALAPIVLFLTTEMVVRIPIQLEERYDRILNWIRLVITFAIAGFSGWVSYWHMKEVSMMLGEKGEAAYFYPLIIDGMMIVATISLLALARVITSVETVEAVAAAETKKVQARRCKPNCDCGRHNRKVETKVVTRKPRAAQAPKQRAATPEVTAETVSA